MEPVQTLIYQEAKLDMQENMVSLPSAKNPSILAYVEEVGLAIHLPARSCLQLLGTMTLMIKMVE